jgi:mannose-6-phosphate isomerase-like protein (cupin superfamily)
MTMARMPTVKVAAEILTATEWQDKCWGRTRCLIERPHYQLHQLEVEEGYCSIHYHRDRANRFIVESGEILVTKFFHVHEEYHRVLPGHHFDVPSLVVHQFTVIKPGEVFEEYFPDRGGTIRTTDIVRLTVGGVNE